jgi:archaellum component FlaC
VLRPLIEYIHDLLLLARETKENRDDIEKLQTRVEDLTQKVQALTFEFERFREEERHEREKLMLRIENALLKFERQLPPAKEPKRLK